MSRLGLTPQLIAATLFLAGGLLFTRAEDAPMAPPANGTGAPVSPKASPAPASPGADDASRPSPATPAPKSAAAAPRMMSGMTNAEILARFDTNHDGKLDEDEVAAAHEAMLKEQVDRQATRAAAAPGGPAAYRQRLIEMFDKNHDGRLDEEEMAAARQYLAGRGLTPDGEVQPELLKRFDKNGDGKLDDEERAAMEKFIQERRAQAGGGRGNPAMREFLLRQFDANHDGKIDDSEMAQLEKVMRPRMETNPQQLARYDKNGDGKIDDAEWAEARAQIVMWLNAPVAAVSAKSPAAGDSPHSADDQSHLDKVAEEMAKRRQSQENK